MSNLTQDGKPIFRCRSCGSLEHEMVDCPDRPFTISYPPKGMKCPLKEESECPAYSMCDKGQCDLWDKERGGKCLLMNDRDEVEEGKNA